MPNAKPLPGKGPQEKWQHRQLYDNVIKALHALPEQFESSIQISNFRATDVFTLNTALGASIEDAVVKGLNRARKIWDPIGDYSGYLFERQAQAFPDVRLVAHTSEKQVCLMGIELKGWFAMSKEGEPTFRYQITPDACAAADLLVVFPWILSDVVAGKPILLRPFVTEARYAAELRNWYWKEMRNREGRNGNIVLAKHRSPYPTTKVDQCLDRAAEDGGGNFGRVARYGLMNEWVKSISNEHISGIPLSAWVTFFKLFGDKVDGDTIASMIEGKLGKQVGNQDSEIQKQELADAFRRVVEFLENKAR